MTNPDLYPVELDPSASSFVANGHTYYVEREGRLSVERDGWLEKFGLYATLGRQSTVLVADMRRVHDALNDGKLADAAIIVDNIIKAAADMSIKAAPLYYICTLFINREDEDRKSYSLELGKQKIADWSGISAFFFSHLALSYLQITAESWKSLIQSISAVPTVDMTLQTPSPLPFESK
ncbi:hypothetical protein DYU11_11500 [Fibrisoma montanum]|uniref:Uncharacterized protein n=1 Tax=Fibrisoma montanum TaxID=2305895 RepID=A0A418MB54_9BACT|nr:hypothetical protein [Fibrisoma montanum]RIV23599.1 hypothetical protein DYU11_11500 [Fibrisoma montanum]